MVAEKERAQLHAAEEALQSAQQQLKNCRDVISYLKSSVAISKAAIAQTTAQDPLDVLPDELKLRVLDCLDFPNIVRLRQVCRKWKAFIDMTPDLWYNLDLHTQHYKSARSIIKQNFLEFAMRAAKYHTRSIALCRSEDPRRLLQALVSKCRDLERVTFIYDHDFANLPAEDILIQAKNLKHITMIPGSIEKLLARFHKQLVTVHDVNSTTEGREPVTRQVLPRLERLNLTTAKDELTGAENGGPEIIAARLPALKELSLKLGWSANVRQSRVLSEDFQHFVSLESLMIDWFCDPRAVQYHPVELTLPPQLKVLRLSDAPRNIWHQLELPLLEELDIPMRCLVDLQISLLPDEYTVLNGGSSLRKLRLRDWTVEDGGDAESFEHVCRHPRLDNLEQLALQHFEGSQLQFLNVSVHHMRLLRIIDFSHSAMHHHTVRQALKAPNLEQLHPGTFINAAVEPVILAQTRGILVESIDHAHEWDRSRHHD